MRLLKSHGLGNDYLVLFPDESPESSSFRREPEPAAIRLLCDRHLGLGSDGLLLPVSSSRALHGLRIFNPDGSEAEKSGNGLRIFARFLHDHQGAPSDFAVEVGGALVRCRVEGEEVEVDMGIPTFKPPEIPMLWPEAQAVDLLLPEAPVPITAVGMGNPHCVLFLDQDPESLPWREIGARLERLPLFPNRINVQFARILNPSRVAARIWERGAGETLASGSSACAIAAAGMRLGRLGSRVAVEMPGGILHIRAAADGMLTLRGPVAEIGELRPSAAFLAALETVGRSACAL